MGSSEPVPSLLGPKARKWIGPALIILGVQCWLVLGQNEYGLQTQRWLLLGAMAVSIIPPINRRVISLLHRLRSPSRSARRWIALTIALLAAVYLPFTAWNQGRQFIPTWQDEQSYAIQVQMLSHGRLWMPMHPLADFFDTFQMIVKPVYASMYFPGASIFYVPGPWLGIPYWIVSSIISGACVGLIYWIVSELIDGVAGILAALMLAAVEPFRRISIMLLGHPGIILLTLLMIAFWLIWRRDRSIGWAVALGFVSGWAAITRPLDALIVAIPIGIDMLLELRPQRPARAVQIIATIIAGAVPFLILQMIFNLGVTASFLRTPFGLHADLYYPDTSLGFHPFDPSHRPASVLPQKQRFHDDWTIPAIKRHQPDKYLSNLLNEDLNSLITFTLPHAWFTLLLPAGLLGLINRTRSLVVLMIPLWIGLYSLYTFSLPHYALVVASAMILLSLLGAQQIENLWPRARPAMGTFLTLAILILCLTELREFNRHVRDEFMDSSELTVINARLSQPDVKRPAVVLFHFTDGNSPAVEPVYNTDVRWPDRAVIIRAHDLGERNQELFDYYAKYQPDRALYLYDRGDSSLKYLGLARERGHAN